jgi:DNA polymerase III delta prime subunit
MWVDTYRPTNPLEYIFKDASLKEFVTNVIETGDMPHLLLAGVQGTGKTSLWKLLVNKLDVDRMDLLVVNASDNNSVDFVRDVVKNFVNVCPMGDMKVLVLEEADRLTIDAQGALKAIIEDNSDVCRFVLTTNRVHKIVPAIRSRCQEFMFEALDRDDIAEKLAVILSKEGVDFDIDDVDQLVDLSYPDIRRAIHLAQKFSVSGTLTIPQSVSAADDITDLLKQAITKPGGWANVRESIIASIKGDQWNDVYRALFDEIDTICQYKKGDDQWAQSIIDINESQRDHAFVADPEINGISLLIKLNNTYLGK